MSEEKLSNHQKKIVEEMNYDGAYIYEYDYGDSFVLVNPNIEYGERGLLPSTVKALERKGIIKPNRKYYSTLGARKYYLSPKPQPHE